MKDIEDKLTITYVGHSLGGMTLPMYIINQKIRKEKHYLSNAILLSPAGIHDNCPRFVHTCGAFFYYVLYHLINHIAIPNLVVDIISKVFKDVSKIPAARDLLTWFSA